MRPTQGVVAATHDSVSRPVVAKTAVSHREDLNIRYGKEPSHSTGLDSQGVRIAVLIFAVAGLCVVAVALISLKARV